MVILEFDELKDLHSTSVVDLCLRAPASWFGPCYKQWFYALLSKIYLRFQLVLQILEHFNLPHLNQWCSAAKPYWLPLHLRVRLPQIAISIFHDQLPSVL